MKNAQIGDVKLTRVSSTGIMVSAIVNFNATYTDDMCSGVFRALFGSLGGEMNLNAIDREVPQQHGWYFLDGEAQLQVEDVDTLFGGEFEETENEYTYKKWNGLPFTDLGWEVQDEEESEEESELPW